MRKLNCLLLLGLAVLGGCKSDDSSQDRAASEGGAATLSANTVCPMSGEPVSADVETVSFNGQEVGFCCESCAAKFEALSDADKAAKLASH